MDILSQRQTLDTEGERRIMGQHCSRNVGKEGGGWLGSEAINIKLSDTGNSTWKEVRDKER